jgi:hypothetical protein
MAGAPVMARLPTFYKPSNEQNKSGMQVWVDLNVSHRFAEYNLLGVPEGYNAFFTRGVSGWQPHLELNLEMAQRISGRKQPNMYVYGGGKDIETWCQQHGIRYLAEYMSHLRKKDGKP